MSWYIRFAAAAQQLMAEWGELTPEARLQRIVAAANQELAEIGVPPCAAALVPKDSLGEFSHTEWTMELQETVFKQRKVSREQLSDLADTVYHEARHAEQMFTILRLLAALGKSEKEIKQETGISGKIVALASASPLPISETGWSPAMIAATRWYESLFGAGARQRKEDLLTLREIKSEVFQLELGIETKHKALKTLAGGRRQLKALVATFQKAGSTLGSLKVLFLQAFQEFKTGKIRKEFQPSLVEWNKKVGKDGTAVKALAVCKQRILQVNLQLETEKKEAVSLHSEIRSLFETLQEARTIYEIFHETYLLLPEEEDAWQVGRMISAALLETIPELSAKEKKAEEEAELLLELGLDPSDLEVGEESGEEPILELSLPEPEEEEDVEPHPLAGEMAAIEQVLNQMLEELTLGLAVFTPIP